MTPADLQILIQEGEGTTLEFKEGLSASFAHEFVGLTNTLGGKIPRLRWNGGTWKRQQEGGCAG